MIRLQTKRHTEETVTIQDIKENFKKYNDPQKKKKRFCNNETTSMNARGKIRKQK